MSGGWKEMGNQFLTDALGDNPTELQTAKRSAKTGNWLLADATPPMPGNDKTTAAILGQPPTSAEIGTAGPESTQSAKDISATKAAADGAGASGAVTPVKPEVAYVRVTLPPHLTEHHPPEKIVGQAVFGYVKGLGEGARDMFRARNVIPTFLPIAINGAFTVYAAERIGKGLETLGNQIGNGLDQGFTQLGNGDTQIANAIITGDTQISNTITNLANQGGQQGMEAARRASSLKFSPATLRALQPNVSNINMGTESVTIPATSVKSDITTGGLSGTGGGNSSGSGSASSEGTTVLMYKQGDKETLQPVSFDGKAEYLIVKGTPTTPVVVEVKGGQMVKNQDGTFNVQDLNGLPAYLTPKQLDAADKEASTNYKNELKLKGLEQDFDQSFAELRDNLVAKSSKKHDENANMQQCLNQIELQYAAFRITSRIGRNGKDANGHDGDAVQYLTDVEQLLNDLKTVTKDHQSIDHVKDLIGKMKDPSRNIHTIPGSQLAIDAELRKSS
jgi:hypothetical protein